MIPSVGAELDHLGRVRERPRPPWHPVPLAELVSLVGLVVMAVGLVRGGSAGATLVAAGLAVAVLGVVELCLREHVAGHRSHTTLLAFVPVVALHTAVVLLLPVAVVGVAAIALDVAVFAVAAWALRRLWCRALDRAADAAEAP